MSSLLILAPSSSPSTSNDENLLLHGKSGSLLPLSTFPLHLSLPPVPFFLIDLSFFIWSVESERVFPEEREREVSPDNTTNNRKYVAISLGNNREHSRENKEAIQDVVEITTIY